MTRGPLFAAGADGEGQGTPRVARLLSGLGVWMAVKSRPWPSSCDGSVSRRNGKYVYIGGPCGTELAVRSVGSLPYVESMFRPDAVDSGQY